MDTHKANIDTEVLKTIASNSHNRSALAEYSIMHFTTDDPRVESLGIRVESALRRMACATSLEQLEHSAPILEAEVVLLSRAAYLGRSDFHAGGASAHGA